MQIKVDTELGPPHSGEKNYYQLLFMCI